MKFTNHFYRMIDLFRSRYRLRKFFVPACLISIIITLFLGWFSQFIFISEFLKRANAELAAPIVGHRYLIDKIDRNKINTALSLDQIPEITILKVTDSDLRSDDLVYPPSHGFHGRRLTEILEAGAPKALFIDILFLDPRNDPQVLLDALCDLRKAGTKIYLASILPKSPLSSDFKGLTIPAGKNIDWPVGDNACSLLAAEVSVRKLTDEFTNQTWGYCLNDGFNNKNSGMSNKCQRINSGEYGITKINSAAYQIYLDIGNDEIVNGKSDEMALTWATEKSEDKEINHNDNNCRNGRSVFDFLAWPDVIKQILNRESVKPFCSYFNELTIAEFRNNDNKESLISNKIVFYGYQLDGINDFSYVPARGYMHSMNVHAMALDNLLVYKDNSKFNKELFDSISLVIFNITLQILIILISEASNIITFKSRLLYKLQNCPFLPKMIHLRSLFNKLIIISLAPILIIPTMYIGSNLLNLGVMSWIEYAAIGFLSEAFGLRKMIEEDLVSLNKFIYKWRGRCD